MGGQWTGPCKHTNIRFICNNLYVCTYFTSIMRENKSLETTAYVKSSTMYCLNRFVFKIRVHKLIHQNIFGRSVSKIHQCNILSELSIQITAFDVFKNHGMIKKTYFSTNGILKIMRWLRFSIRSRYTCKHLYFKQLINVRRHEFCKRFMWKGSCIVAISKNGIY